jgi:hypothetical protein
MIEHKTLEQIMKEGWIEELEFGFGRKSILYSRKDDRLIYDEIEQNVILTYSTTCPKYKG